MSKFTEPDLSQRPLELRFDGNEVCIYGSAEGLTKLAELLTDLVNNPGQGHIHLDEYQVLTAKSLPGAISVF